MVSDTIARDNHHLYSRIKPNSVEIEWCIEKNPSLTYNKDKVSNEL